MKRQLVAGGSNTAQAPLSKVPFGNTKKIVVLFLLVTALCALSAGTAARLVRSPAQVAADAKAPPRTALSSTVFRGSVTEAIAVRGTVTPGDSITIDAASPEGMDPVLTGIPKKVGRGIVSGEVVVEISYRPVIALAGKIPLVRDLHQGSIGADVEELQRSLVRLGSRISDASGAFGPSTADALRRLYRSVGYSPPYEEIEVPRETKSGELEVETRRVIAARKSELRVVPGLPGKVTSISGKIGATVGEKVATITTSPATVQAAVSPAQGNLVHVGDLVTIASSAPAYESKARIKRVGSAEQDPETKSFGIPITLVPRKALPDGIFDKGLEVHIEVEDGREGSIVPVSAVFADPDGRTAVLKVVGSTTKKVPVRVVETGSGRARVEPVVNGELQVGDEIRVEMQLK